MLAWCYFSAAAVVAQWQLYRAALLSPTLQNTSLVLAGTALLIAGLYQLTPLKMACLRGCRSPLTFIMTEWREGYGGAFTMGLRHGFICVGCCWALMSLMFCVSVMDLRWAAALAIYAAAEKLIPGGDTIVAPAFGSAAILGGAGLIAFTLLIRGQVKHKATSGANGITMMGPLAGFRIVEFAGIGPAPMAAMLFADLGASVIRLDRLAPSGLGIDMPMRFDLLARSRPSVALDMKNPEGVALTLELIGKADALIEGFRPGTMERLGLGPDVALSRNPRAGLRPHDRLGTNRSARRRRPDMT